MRGETMREVPETSKPKETREQAKDGRRGEFDRLIPLCQAGDRKAWDRLTRLAEPIILNVTDRFGMKRQDAEDLKQKILGDLVGGKIARYRMGDFEAWLRVLTRNEAMTWYRNEGRRGKHEVKEEVGDQPTAEAGPEESLISAQMEHFSRQELEDMLDFLKVRKKRPAWAEIFRLHYIEGLSHMEVAAKLGIPPNTVHTSMARARIAIKEEYGIDLLEALGKTHLKRAA